MSIKTIDQEIRSNTAGVAKRINKGAERMVFDILQSTQYSNPIPSTIRELVTNACDSQREKEIAIEILTGVKTEEDYFIRRDGEQYSDSNFNRDYYDLKYLNTDIDTVTINYKRNEGVGYCDVLEIIDHGVGIGGKRLEGILELGYSTKRNTSQNFGAFGLGAKVALSTGVEFYTIETVHNGKKFKCNCYPYKTDFMIPKFNPYIEFSDGTKVHYEETDEKNYTIVSFGVKKHNRSRFEEAVEEQLNYLGNVKFFIQEQESRWEKNIHSNVLHNSDHVIVTDSYVYSRPHIVVVKDQSSSVGINYGYVDFRELEMEQLYGSVGLKCPIRQTIKDPDTGEEIVLQEGVEVTPSREKVIWNENTKKFIQGVIDKASEEASELVEQQLNETDFLKWVKACYDIIGKGLQGSGSALRQLSKIIDTSKLRPKYSEDKSIEYLSPKSLFRGFSPRVVNSYVKGGDLHIETNKIEGWSDINFDAIYYRSEDVSRNRTKDLYLSELHSKFVIITDSDLSQMQEDVNNASLPDLERAEKRRSLNAAITNKLKIKKHLEASELLKSYDDVEVPDEWIKSLQSREENLKSVETMSNLTPEERRKLENKIVAYSLRINTANNRYGKPFIWDKVEPKIATIYNSTRTTYYGTSEDEDKLVFAAEILRSQTLTLRKVFPTTGGFYSDEVCYYFDALPSRFSPTKSFDQDALDKYDGPQLLKVNESNVKYLKSNPNCKHIDEFFYSWDETSNTYIVDSKLKIFLTGKAIGSVPDWLRRVGFINPEYSEMYENLCKYVDVYRNIDVSSAGLKDIIDMLERMIEFQHFVNSTDNKEDIAEKSRELFILEDIKAADILDYEAVKLNRSKEEFIEGVDNLMSYISFPYDDTLFEKEVEFYLKSRGKLDIEINLPHKN